MSIKEEESGLEPKKEIYNQIYNFLRNFWTYRSFFLFEIMWFADFIKDYGKGQGEEGDQSNVIKDVTWFIQRIPMMLNGLMNDGCDLVCGEGQSYFIETST